MRKVIFLGGPCDGKAMWWSEPMPPLLHAPVSTPLIFDPVESESVFGDGLRIATYKRERLTMPVKSVCEFYSFESIR